MHLSAALLGIAALLTIGGCGGSGSSSTDGPTLTTPATASTKTELIKRGDAICRKSDQKQTTGLKAYIKQHPNEQSTKADQEKMVAEVGLPPIKSEIEQLSELGAPAQEQVQYGAIVSAWEGALEAAEEDPGRILGETENPFTGVDKLAGEYGFVDCAHAT